MNAKQRKRQRYLQRRTTRRIAEREKGPQPDCYECGMGMWWDRLAAKWICLNVDCAHVEEPSEGECPV